MGQKWEVELVTSVPHHEKVVIESVDPDDDKFWAMDRAYDYGFDMLGWDEVEIVSIKEVESND